MLFHQSNVLDPFNRLYSRHLSIFFDCAAPCDEYRVKFFFAFVHKRLKSNNWDELLQLENVYFAIRAHHAFILDFVGAVVCRRARFFGTVDKKVRQDDCPVRFDSKCYSITKAPQLIVRTIREHTE